MAMLSVTSFIVLFAVGIANGSPMEPDRCSKCQNMLTTLTNMVDEQMRYQIVETLCEESSPESQEMCTTLSMSPTELCEQFGECSPNSLVFEPNEDLTAGSGHFTLPCVLCKNIMKIAHAFLQSKNHQEFILKAMKSVCHFVPFLSNECVHLIDTYGPLAIHIAATYLSPQSCSLFHLCPAGLVDFEDDCKVCRFGVGVLYDTVQDPEIETKIQGLTDVMCEEYDGSAEECNDIARDFAEFLVKVAEELRTSDILKNACKEANICPDDIELGVTMD